MIQLTNKCCHTRLKRKFLVWVYAFFLFFFLTNSTYSQDRCDQALDIGIGDCQTYFNGFATADVGTGQFCDAVYDNNLWYTFVAIERRTRVTLIPTFCIGNRGLQMEIFQATLCTFFDVPLACGPTSGVSPLAFEIDTDPGETYYIIIDGARADVCDYKINLTHGLCPDNPADCDVVVPPVIVGEDSICFNQGINQYTIANYDPGLEYYWSCQYLRDYTILNDSMIEIDWRDFSQFYDPVLCVSAVDSRCKFSTTCFNIVNTNFGNNLKPQTVYRCPSNFPMNLTDWFVLLFVGELTILPDKIEFHFYLSRQDLLNDENEISQIDTAGNYQVFVAMTLGNCHKIPFPKDTAFIFTQDIDLEVTTQQFCYGETFRFEDHVTVHELNGYPGYIFDSLAFYTTASDAAGNRNRLTLPYSVTENGTYWARFNSSIGCSDTIRFEVEFHDIPVFTAESPDTMCSVLGDAMYNLLSTKFDFSVGDISQMTYAFYNSPENAINNVGQISPVVNASRTYYAVAISEYGCRSAPVAIDVVFLISPYIELFGNDELCRGDSGEILITTINGPVPFTVVLEDDFGNRDTIYSFEPSIFYYRPIYESTEFRLISYSTEPSTFCPYEYAENIEFEVKRLPFLSIEVATGCGSETGIYLRGSQDGDFNVYIRDIISGETYYFPNAQNNEFLSIPVVNGTVLVLDSFQYDNECWSYVADTTNPIVVQQPLEINNISIGACDPLQSVISFTISGGDVNTYQVVGIPGNIQGNQRDFVSDALSTGNYEISIIDGRQCDTVELNIMIDCGCQTEAGAIEIIDTVLCENEILVISTIRDTQLVAGDAMQFLLHDQAAPVFGNIIQSNNLGSFSFDGSEMTLGDRYYITMWVGPALNGGVDTTAFCALYSNTIAVRWLSIPAVTIFDMLFLCESPVDTSVIINFTGDGPYTFSYQINSTIFGPLTTDQNSVVLTLNGLFQNDVLTILDFSNEACDGVVNGAGQIIFIENPEFRNLIYTCATSKDSFTFEVELLGGSPPYDLSGVSGQLIGNTFISDPLPSGYSGTLYLSDENNCDIIELEINRDCECESSTGILPADDLFLCADEVINLPFVFNPIVAPGDGQKFLIKSNGLSDSTGVLAILDNAVIQYDPAYMVYGQTYYILSVTGQLDVNGNIIYDNKCFMPSVAVAFTFYDTPQIEIALSSDTLNCINRELMIDASGSTVPIGFQFEWTVISGQIISGDQTLQPIVDQEGRYNLRIFSPLAGCEEERIVDIYLNEETANAILIADTLLNCAVPSIRIDGSNSNTGGELTFEWSTSDGHFSSATDNLIVDVDEAGTYVLIVENKSSGCRDTAELTIHENFTTPVALIDISDYLLTCETEHIQLLLDVTLLSADDVVNWYGTQPFSQLSPYEIEIGAPGTFTVVVTNSESQCTDSVVLTIGQDIQEPILQLEDSYFIDCIDQIADMKVDVLNPGMNTYAYSWTSTDASIIGDPTNDEISADMEGSFFVEVINLYNGCRAQATTQIMALQEPINSIELLVDPSPCGSKDQGAINLENIEGGTGPFSIELDGRLYNDIPLTIGNLTAGQHTLTITDVNQCTFDTTFVVRDLIDVSVDLPTVIRVDEGNSIHIIPSISGAVDTFLWIQNDTSLLSIDRLDPTLFPEEDFVLRLVLNSPDSCVAEDVVQIYVRLFYNIYIPTAFSPNDDAINDQLVIYGPEKLQSVESFQIFDRWGSKVYESYDFIPNDNQFGWDGTMRDQEAPAGVYVYHLHATFKDGTTKQIAGEVSLVR